MITICFHFSKSLGKVLLLSSKCVLLGNIIENIYMYKQPHLLTSL